MNEAVKPYFLSCPITIINHPLQPSLKSSSSFLLNAAEEPGQSTPQVTTPMSKTVINMKSSSHMSHHNIDTNTNNNKNTKLPRKHQTVRFIAGHRNGKSTGALAASEESIVSDDSFAKNTSFYGSSKHVRMMVTLKILFFFPFSFRFPHNSFQLIFV